MQGQLGVMATYNFGNLRTSIRQVIYAHNHTDRDEQVRQRQARLAFLRRQDAARRRADRAQSVTATGAETIMVGFLRFTVY